MEDTPRKGSGSNARTRTGHHDHSGKIEGYVIMNRKQAWVRRYARVENQLFSYKKDKRDQSNRLVLDLRQARIRYSNSQGGSTGEGFENFIQITFGNESMVLAFENFLEFESWKRSFVNA